MRAGRLRHRVLLERPTEQVVAGEPRQAFVPDLTVWARIEPLYGRELTDARQFSSRVTHAISMRYERPALTAAWRVRFGDRLFNLHAVLVRDERMREVQVMAEEVTA